MYLCDKQQIVYIRQERIPLETIYEYNNSDDPFDVQVTRKRVEQTTHREIVNRRHRLDHYKLYYPGYM
jgi:hypothetical protein